MNSCVFAWFCVGGGDARRLYRIEPADLQPGDTVLILGINGGKDTLRVSALIAGFSPFGVLPPDHVNKCDGSSITFCSITRSKEETLKTCYVCLSSTAVIVLVAGATALHSGERGRPGDQDRIPPAARKEIKSVEQEIDRIEGEALNRARSATLDRFQQIILLGKLIFYDQELSVQRNESCSFCHMPETGFTGPVSALNQTTAAYPGSVRTRFSGRKPQSHTYASYSPVLHYNLEQGDFVGGQFWDMRATGLRLDSALAEQAQGPPLDPTEMGLIDPACMVYRMSDRPYRSMAERLWGVQAFAVQWPANVKEVCDRPGPASHKDPLPLHLAAVDRGIAQTTFDRIAEAIAAFEGSPEVNPFSSKYDYVMAGKAEFTPEEKAGYELFRSKATHCNECHRDGGPGEEPLFTDFTASNLGLPPNPALPFYKENTPDHFGYTANPDGLKFLDLGVSGFLASPQNPSREWAVKAKSFLGKYKTPTLRNVDKRPRADFVKAYMHNGYLKSLKEVVHFYNTRDALPKCKPGDPGQKVTCWPAPENPETINRKQLGDLKLTDKQEDMLVAFLKTLTDEYAPQEK
jgi:cytochrome c peroxidase